MLSRAGSHYHVELLSSSVAEIMKLDITAFNTIKIYQCFYLSCISKMQPILGCNANLQNKLLLMSSCYTDAQNIKTLSDIIMTTNMIQKVLFYQAYKVSTYS